MIKLAYCVPYLWNPGGIDRVITVKANYLAEVMGYDVTIITSDQQGVKPYFPLSPKVKLIDLDINFYSYQGKTHGRCRDLMTRAWRSTWKRRLFRQRLTKALKELSPDITISASRRELPFLYKIKAGGIKIAERHMCRNNRLHQQAGPLLTLLNRYLTVKEDRTVGKYDCAVTLTDEDRQMWSRNSNMVVIPNPLTEPALGVAGLTNKRVIAVGRICSEKGFDRLIAAWSKVEKRFPDWQLQIVGSQDFQVVTDQLREDINRLGLRNVELVAHTHAIGEVYLNASILALSSHYEGLPLVIIEAMACGVPCVAMACQCGPRDIITSGEDGLLVEEGDIDALADGLIRLIEDEQLRKEMGAAALRRSADYALPTIMQRWDKLFHQLTDRK